MIDRIVIKQIKSRMFKDKAILVVGPRQVGKTTLIRSLLSEMNESHLFLDGDDSTVRQLLAQPNTAQIRQIVGANRIVFIDEAQRIPTIGLTSKIITDQMKGVQLILSGSSSFELNNLLIEPLTGRKFTFHLYPICWQEWEQSVGYVAAEQRLDQQLVLGFYPDILTHSEDPRLLTELAESYLYKDVLSLSGIRKPETIHKLVQALAWQLGSEVSFKELADTVSVDIKTVINYVDILEKAFVVFRLPAFSGNLRNEIKNNRKIYFHDNGIRNAVIAQLQPLAVRQDVGALWENFLVSERWKHLQYNNKNVGRFFWRTTAQQEIDYIEVESNKQIHAFEFKWNPRKKVSFPKTFMANYQSTTEVISRANFRSFLS